MSNPSLNLIQPSIKTTLVNHSQFSHSLVVEPLAPGFGHTIGHSLRRILLSSIPGFAVTRVKINDNITHEYQSVDGSTEDALEILLNLKLLRAKITNDEQKITISLNKTGPGTVTAADFDLDKKGVEIANPDLYICTIDDKSTLKIEVDISRGVGYLPIDRVNLGANTNPQNLLVDALFNPVTNVSMEVEEMRVGDMTNFHRLTLNFDVDGTVTAQEVVDYTINLLIDNLQKVQSSFKSFIDGSQTIPTRSPASEEDQIESELNDLQLTGKSKVIGILNKNGIYTKQDLKEKAGDLEEMAGIDEKILNTLQEYISKI